MITTNQNIHKESGVLNMKKVRHYLAGSIFAALGIIFLYLDMPTTTDHINHSAHISHDIARHDVTLLGIGEMTWMWFTMALVHCFLNDLGCRRCGGKDRRTH